jgi:Cu-Zn family superoxide dismutase
MRLAPLIAALALAGCQSAMQSPDEMARATAQLQPTKGSKTVGEATFEDMGNGRVHVAVIVHKLKPNSEHGFHIHEVGDCSSGDGMSAGGHFNPLGKPHGSPTSAEHHAGDLPALKSDAHGTAKLDTTVSGITVAPGPASIVGRGLVVHADPDDYHTQPTGKSGARLACGVIQAG